MRQQGFVCNAEIEKTDDGLRIIIMVLRKRWRPVDCRHPAINNVDAVEHHQTIMPVHEELSTLDRR